MNDSLTPNSNIPKSMSFIKRLALPPLALCLVANPLSAATSGNFTYTDNGTSITITRYLTTVAGPAVIPPTIAGKHVTTIADDAFQMCTLTSVTIPNSVTSIGNFAFQSCESLTRVTIPNSVTSIGSDAFAYCGSLTNVTIGSGITTIGDYGFQACTSLVSVTIPNTVTSIGIGAFNSCGLTSVTIGSGVTTIGDSAFAFTHSLAKATFLGKAPTLGSTVFDQGSPQFTVNFIKGSTGFTTPTWNGYPSVALPKIPDISVQQPLGSNLVDGVAKKSFGSKPIHTPSAAKTFTISNVGTSPLTGLVISEDGANPASFIVSALAKTTLAPGEKTTFTVIFKPVAIGTRTAAIHISSNDPNENPFDIKLTGLGT